MYKKHTKENLEEVIKVSKSWADVCRKLNIKPFTGAQTYVRNKANSFKIDTKHFTGKAWNKGKSTGSKHDVNYYLAKRGPYISSARLLHRLIKEGLKYRLCEMCKLDSWLGYEIPLELDHINSDHYDNRLENLQILCPTCHALKHKLS